MTRRTLVLGIGNTLLGDEGVGVHAVHALEARLGSPKNVQFLDGGTLSFTLAGPIESTDQLIVIDAAQLNAPPGTVQAFEGEEMDRFLGRQRKRSVHEVGLLDLMTIARLTDALPARRALIAVQPEYVDWADAPTPAVAAAIPRACDIANGLIERWQGTAVTDAADARFQGSQSA
jgi:hydrogenase maturation protease